MSTHTLDVSGARPLTSTVNDPARTAATISAKAGDDVILSVGGCRETRIQLWPGAKIERRRYIRKTQAKDESGRAVKDDAGEFVYDETAYDELILVQPAATVFARSSVRPEEVGGEGVPTYEQTPHTTLSARRMPDLYLYESGELVEEASVAALFSQA